MANRNAPFGLSPVSNINGAEWNEAGHKYYVPQNDTSSYAVGDLIKIAAGADVYGVQQAALCGVGEAARGVIVGIQEVVTLHNASYIPALKFNAYYLRVADDPSLVFSIQEGGTGTALAAANVGSYANILYATNNRFMSATVLDKASINTGVGAFNLHILGLANVMNNTYGLYAKWLVMISNHDLRTAPANSGGVVEITASRSLTAADNGATLISNSASAFTLTVPAGLPSNFGCAIVQNGAGQITLSGSGTTVSNVSSYTKTSAQYAVLALLATGTNTYVFSGSGA